MDFILMLTRDDRTIDDGLAVVDEAQALGIRHIGFKDVGATPAQLRTLAQRIHDANAMSYMEVVSLDRGSALRAAAIAIDIGVRRLMGGTDIATTQRTLAGSGIEYFPFAGFPEGHPTRLGGAPHDIADHCASSVAQGCRGVDLLAYRSTAAPPLELIRAARQALGSSGLLVVAGSINSFDRIAEVRKAGADAFTVGTAVFDGTGWPLGTTRQARMQEILDATEAPSAARERTQQA